MVVPRGFEARLFAAEPEIAKPIAHGLGPPRPALDRRDASTIPTTCSPAARATTGSRSARTPTATARPTSSRSSPTSLSIPTSLRVRQRRRDRPPGARHALPQGHRRRRQGRRAQGPLHRLGHRRHPRRAEQPALWARQLALRDRRLLGLPRRGRRRARIEFRQGFYRFKPDGVEAGVPAQHEQQLVGRRLQRGGPGLRLDGQRLPERLPADPQPLLRGGPRLVAAACSQNIAVDNRFFPITDKVRQVDWHGGFTAGGRACPLHRARLSPPVLEPDRVRRRADRPPGRRPSRSSRKGSDFAVAQRLEPARQRRRVDARPSSPRSAPTAMSG